MYQVTYTILARPVHIVEIRFTHHSIRKSIDHIGGRSSLRGLGEPHVHPQESYPLPPSSLPQVAPKASTATKKKGVSALLKGLRSGEVSKIVDSMDAGNSTHNNPTRSSVHSHHSHHQVPANDGLYTSPHRHSLSNDGLHLGPSESFIDSGMHVPPPVSSPLPKASAAPKKKAIAALLKGLRSGEVSKIVDDMEAPREIAQVSQADPEQRRSTTESLRSPRHHEVHHSPRGSNSAPVSSYASLAAQQPRRSLQHSSPGQTSPLDAPFLMGEGGGHGVERRGVRIGTDATTVFEDLTMNMSSSDSREDFADRGPHVLG